MAKKSQFENWSWSMDSDGVAVIKDRSGNAIASLHACGEKKAFARAALIASAPGLFDTLQSTLVLFRVMADQDEGPAALAANDMIPVLESALAAAEMMGSVTPAKLAGR